jgi:hypothetical protein
LAGFGKSVVSDELVGRDGGGTTRRPHSAPLIAYYRAKFSSLASGRLPPRNRRREFFWPAIDHIPKRQYTLWKGSMIDALLNVAVFAMLVLCIVGFGVNRAQKRVR